jgi:hypothetical protein
MITISITIDAPKEREGSPTPNIFISKYTETHDTPQHLKSMGRAMMDNLQATMLEAGARSGGIIYTRDVEE